MSQFPSYYPNPQMNQPNMGMYQNFNPQINNPYMDRMNQLQQYQQNLAGTQMSLPNQQQGLIGKVVNDFAEITANDVPMNGNAAFFPKSDGSELQARSWAANGTIQTVVYRPIQAENAEQSTSTPQNDFHALNEDVKALREEILARLDSIEKSVAKPAASRGKKGDSDNE